MKAIFKGPGDDEFTCEFLELKSEDRSLEYHVLWAVNEKWIYGSLQESSSVLPKNFSSFQYGTSVSVIE